MKTSIKSLVALVLTTITLSASAFAANETVLTDVKSFNKIKVSGNVEVILVQGTTESVKVYDNYYSKNALVQERNGELSISSYAPEKLTVVVNFTKLSAVNATDNATISSFGKIATLSLDVKLSNNAQANLDVNAINLNSNIEGRADLSLEGTAMVHNASMESLAKVTMDNFSAGSTSIAAKNQRVIAKTFTAEELQVMNIGK